jgi:hypothetical protein
MSLHDAIITSLVKCEEKERQKQSQTQIKPKLTTQTTAKKREINWVSIELMIKKYDSLLQAEKIKANQNWGRTIPFWRNALKYHKLGFSDAETHKKTKEERLKNEKSR